MGNINQDSSANLSKFVTETMQMFSKSSGQGNQLNRNELHTSVNRAYHRVSTDQTASQLSQRLANNGQAELRKFLATSDITNAQKRSILSELHHLNMGNFGVNLVG